MDTESQDALRAFCEMYISQNCQKWPTSEIELADAFVKHFRIPILTDVAGLHEFLVRTNIELMEGDLPADLLGVNMCFEGKRKILTSTDEDYVPFRIHTILHEIREIIEADFRRSGFTTTGSQDLDSRADEFAFATFICSLANPLNGWPEGPWKTESKWREWLSLGLITVGASVVVLYSFFAAFGYRFKNSSFKKR